MRGQPASGPTTPSSIRSGVARLSAKAQPGCVNRSGANAQAAASPRVSRKRGPSERISDAGSPMQSGGFADLVPTRRHAAMVSARGLQPSRTPATSGGATHPAGLSLETSPHWRFVPGAADQLLTNRRLWRCEIRVAFSVGVALIGAAVGAVATGAVEYVGWRTRRPLEWRDSLVEKKVSDRWDASVDLRKHLAELLHASFHVDAGHIDYIERGRSRRASPTSRATSGPRSTVAVSTSPGPARC